MLSKSAISDSLIKELLNRDYDVLLTNGCFDIVAKRENLLLLKTLVNLDSLTEEHAKGVKTVSYFLSASPFIISIKNTRGFLENDLVYNRFGLSAMTPTMFKLVLDNDAYERNSAKGRKTVNIDAKMLREKRQEMKFTMEELSELVGISKKALYEIEKERTNPTEKTVKKLELTLKTNLRNLYSPSVPEKTKMEPKTVLQKTVSRELDRLGVDNSPVNKSPFSIVGKEEYSIISNVSDDSKKLEKSKKGTSKNLDGVPIFKESELPEVENAKELKKIIDEKSEE